ncbi:MAG: hypothetical protein LBM61_00195 [Prevotellaceae bacterium]|jgi:chromosome segregation ATPase|nr:hypothetical protein [Prevotellaceae bacterium]
MENNAIDILKFKTRQLIEEQNTLKREKQRLEEIIQAQQKEINRLNDRLQVLHRDYSNLKMTLTINGKETDIKATKQRLSRLVREVNECIALLGVSKAKTE